MTVTGWMVLSVANIPLYVFLAWILFKDWDEFVEAVKFYITPDIFSLFRGEFVDDLWAEYKLGFWAAGCFASVFVEGYLIQTYFLQ